MKDVSAFLWFVAALLGGGLIGYVGGNLTDSGWIFFAVLPISFAWGWFCGTRAARLLFN